MFTKSIWTACSGTTSFPVLDTDITVDTAVIGGGITGMSLARELSEKDMTVAVIEAGKVGGGTTSHSTGNLYSTVESHLGSLRSAYDTAAVRMVVEARRAAMERIEQNVLHYNIDASFKRQSWFLYSAFGKKDSKIEEELTAGQELNMPVARAGEAEIPFPVTSAVKLTGQAQINPMQYVQGLAQKLSSGRCRIYENSPVTGVHKENGRFRVATARADVKAHHVLHATHTPKGIKFIQTLLGPYREYGIACKLEKNTHPEGIFWGYFDSDSKISTRTYRQNGEEFLIVVGKPHKVGQAESNISHIKQLVEFAYRYFDVPEVIHRWGGQHYRPADHLPYIGRDKKGSEEYIATGYSTDGLVYGTMAGMLISDLIAGKKHPWSDLFDSTRSQPVKAAGKFVKENLNVAKQYLEHLPGSIDDKDLANIAPGEGQVVEKNGEKIAVYKNDEGHLSSCSAVCTHMACIVHWNNAEKTWDCPCHASRFSPDGTVLEGPAYNPLRPVGIRGKT